MEIFRFLGKNQPNIFRLSSVSAEEFRIPNTVVRCKRIKLYHVFMVVLFLKSIYRFKIVINISGRYIGLERVSGLSLTSIASHIVISGRWRVS